MQLKSAMPLPELRSVIEDAQARVKAVGAAVVWPIKVLRMRLKAVMAQPWFFPLEVAVILGVLWLQQHGYLPVPITVCDWARIGR